MSSDLDDLRLFALRNHSGGVTTQHWLLDSNPDQGCPMHGKSNGSFHLPTKTSTPIASHQHMSRRERPSISRRGSLNVHRPKSSSSNANDYRRNSSIDYFYNSAHHYNSIPRMASRPSQHDHAQNKATTREVFTGRVDFKSILRKFDPKDEERSVGSSGKNARRSRHESEPRDSSKRSRGLIVDSDFDFRGGLVTDPDVTRFRSGSVGHVHRRSLRIDTGADANSHSHQDQSRYDSNPLSPRRVEFGEEIVFDFNPRDISRPWSPLPVPQNKSFKPILRHTNSASDNLKPQDDTRSRDKSAATLASDSLVQVYLPDDTEQETAKSDDGDESESEYEDDNQENVNNDHEENDGAINYEDDFKRSSRNLPPMLADWNRSQSFPPPSMPQDHETSQRKLSAPETENIYVSKEEYDMVEHENEALRDRVADLEKRVHDQTDEITCLRATLADALRRINTLEAGKDHVQINHREVVPMRRGSRDHPDGVRMTPATRRSIHQHHEAIGRRASYACNREISSHSVPSRRSVPGGMYQSTTSLHSDGHSSTSMSPSPSPTHHHLYQGRSTTAPVARPGHIMPPPAASGMNVTSTPKANRQLSGSMSNLSLSGSKKWSSTSDFLKEQSPGPTSAMARRLQAGSMHSLRSPFGSQQNLADRGLRHGTKDAVFNEDDGSIRFFIRGRPVCLFAPTEAANNYSLSKVLPAPTARPKLEWVYGYRGRDARSNLHLLPTGEMVYFVAAVVVLFNAEEHSQRHYLGHTDDVKCLVVHPNRLLIASGQAGVHDRREGRAHIRIWNSVSLQTLHVLGVGDFERAVICLSFSKADGGNLLLAIDEGSDHILSVWDWSRSERGHKVTETKCSTETVVAAEFHPLEAGLIVTIGKGHVNFWQLDSTALTLSRKTGLFDQRDKPKYVTCLAFSSTGDVLTGDSNGNVFVWGRGYNAVTKALRKVHEGPIFSICVLKDGSIVTGGGRDRRLVQFDSVYKRTGLEAELPEHLGSVRTISQGKGSQLVLGSTRNSILQGTFELGFQDIVVGHVDEVWALAAHPQQSQFISAGYDMHIHLWDTLSHRTVWSSSLGDQAQSACFSSTGEIIIVGMTSGKWMVLDSQTREVYGVYQDGHDVIQTVRLSPDDKYLALGSKDGIVYVYQSTDSCKKFSRMGRCVTDAAKRRSQSSSNNSSVNVSAGTCSSITYLDWSSDGTYIRTNSGDYELQFWNATICRPVTNASTLRDVEWSSQTCILSFATLGVWPETADGIDIYSCAKSKNGKVLATGDDCGKIKLFANPASQPKSLHHSVGGHSSQVTRLDFLSDDSKLISSGGRDTAIMQWSIA